MSHSIQFHTENLGPLATGNLDLTDLTVICGENNTGKTYLTYAFYGLLRMLPTLIDPSPFDVSRLREYGVLDIDLESHVIEKAPSIIQSAVTQYCSQLHWVLAAQETRFANTRLKLSLDFTEVLGKPYNNRFSTERNRHIVSFEKPENSSILTVNAINETSAENGSRLQYGNLIRDVVTEICFERAIPSPFIVSVERTGAIMFQSELNLAKNRLIDLASEVSSPNAILTPSQVLERVYGSGYPLPVRDNVNFINSLANVQTGQSDLIKSDQGILDDFEDLIGGSYSLRNNVVYFVPRKTRVRLQMSESSSAVRSLVILGHYLKHVATKGDLLMIDEPELNLHPANQRKLARLLVRLVNAGIKVFVTTHSDYIVKEFNTLIMLKHDREKDRTSRRHLPYREDEALDYSRVNVYMLRPAKVHKPGNQRRSTAPTLCKAAITPTLGIELPSFDETINDMTAIQESLYYGTEYMEAN